MHQLDSDANIGRSGTTPALETGAKVAGSEDAPSLCLCFVVGEGCCAERLRAVGLAGGRSRGSAATHSAGAPEGQRESGPRLWQLAGCGA